MAGFSIVVMLGLMSSFFYIFLALLVLTILYLIISYLFDSMAINNLMKENNCKHIGTSFIPIYHKYLLGKLAGNKALGIVFMTSTLITLVFEIVTYFYTSNWYFIIIIIISIINFILNIIISDKIYKDKVGNYSIIFTILSILSLGLLRPIFLFALSSKRVKN